jgi:hypothetical protein
MEMGSKINAKILLISILMILVIFFLVYPKNQSQPSPETLKLGIWCYLSAMSPQFLLDINRGHFDFIVLGAGSIWSDNLLHVTSTFGSAVSQVKQANPNVEIYASIASWAGAGKHSGLWSKEEDPSLNIPDFSTNDLRQKTVQSVVDFYIQYQHIIDGIVDDCEVYYGNSINDQYQYFNLCSGSISYMTYYTVWVHYAYTLSTSAKDVSVGLYGGHGYYETEWKTALDRVQTDSNSKNGYQLWLMVEHYLDYPTVRQQLAFFDDKTTEHGWDYYNKLDAIGLWWYDSMTEDDWNAWITWTNKLGAPN